MTQWDFTADIERLLATQEAGDLPRRMPDIVQAATNLVRRARQDDPKGLVTWLGDNAEMLVGQQLLVASVHAQQDPDTALPRALTEWARQVQAVIPADAVEWLKQEYPGLLRAWLLSRVDELVAAQLKGD